jgi:hypothetical protein
MTIPCMCWGQYGIGYQLRLLPFEDNSLDNWVSTNLPNTLLRYIDHY